MNGRQKYFASQIESEAARWAARFECGNGSENEYAAFEEWLRSDTAHRACYAQYQQFSERLNEVLPAMAAGGSAAAAPEEKPRRAPALAWFAGLGAVAAATAVIGFSIRAFTDASGPPHAERQTLHLADGTRADLNTQTDVVVALSDTQRRVRLTRGEVMFSVAKDPARPFIVETPAGLVRVTGTVFNVRTSPQGRLEVTVLEGSVDVEPNVRPLAASGEQPAAALKLAPGQQVSLGTAPINAADVRNLETALLLDVVAWRDGGILFEGTPLAAALERFARYHQRRIVAAEAVKELRLGGRFSLDDLDGFLSALGAAFPVKIVREADGAIRVNGRDPSR